MDIKKNIKERGFTLAEVCAKMKGRDGQGIAPQSLSQMLKGNPTIDKLTEIADIVGISVSELVAEEEEKFPKIICPSCKQPFRIELTPKERPSVAMSIKSSIERYGWTMEGLAARMCYNYGTKYLNMSAKSLEEMIEGNPTASELLDMACAMGIHVSDMVAEERVPMPELACPHCGKLLSLHAQAKRNM